MALPVLRTGRLILRPWDEQDLETLHSMWTDEHVRRYLFDEVTIALDRAADILHCHLRSAEEHNIGSWTIHVDPAGPAIGFCGFSLTELNGIHEAELMYGLLPGHCGRGLATEAASAALDYLWSATTRTRVVARVDAPNEKSIAVLDRLGMQFVSQQVGITGQPLLTFKLERPSR